jgi:hypothetical protein
LLKIYTLARPDPDPRPPTLALITDQDPVPIFLEISIINIYIANYLDNQQ